MYDVIIIGGGPGGVAAGVYAARKKMKTAIIADTVGGQSVISVDIQNWIGTPSISGFEFSQALERHLRAQKDNINIVDGERAETIEKLSDGTFHVTTRSKKVFETKTILLTIGSRHRRLEIPGEKEFEGHGVVYCATCDAPLFKGKEVVVVGGGNSGLEAVVDLLPYATKIYLIHRGESLKGDKTTQDKIVQNQNVEIILNAVPREIHGEGKIVSELLYEDIKTGEKKILKVQGVFVETGVQPNSEIVKDLVKRSEWNSIVVNPQTQETSCPGIWAAGDVTDALYRQNNISAGDAIKAILNIYDYLHIKGK
ncbi:MAG: FAD-dependent oxidoreductase [Candidatus Paceibacterota bacterium]|jgi:alkyl hydroperoxide reductase subunit F